MPLPGRSRPSTTNVSAGVLQMRTSWRKRFGYFGHKENEFSNRRAKSIPRERASDRARPTNLAHTWRQPRGTTWLTRQSRLLRVRENRRWLRQQVCGQQSGSYNTVVFRAVERTAGCRVPTGRCCNTGNLWNSVRDNTIIVIRTKQSEKIIRCIFPFVRLYNQPNVKIFISYFYQNQ